MDQDYPVLELSPLAGLGMEYGDVPSAGIVACIAKISGQLCVINANDATVKGIDKICLKNIFQFLILIKVSV